MSIQYFSDSDVNGIINAFYNTDVWEVEKIPKTAVEITYDEWLDAIHNQGKYIVKSGALVLAPPPSAAELLAQAKADKIIELNQACNNALQTFTSDALGTIHTYLSDKEESWPLLTGEYGYVIGPDFDNTPIPWYTVEAGFQSHTGVQFRKVYTDGRAWVQYCKVKCDELSKQAQAATTVLQVQAIVWD